MAEKLVLQRNSSIVSYDRWGFAVFKNGKQPEDDKCHTCRPNLYLGFKLVGQEDYFELDYIVDDVRQNGVNCSKTIVYAPTMEECSDIYFYFYKQLRKQMIVGDTRLVHTYFEMAGEETLKYIKEQFSNADSPIRVLIAEVDYEIDFNVDGVFRVVHWGGPKNAISYWKEVGYAGRDGEFCDCMLFYIPKILREVAYDWKFIAELRQMANLPTKKSNTNTQSSQTKMTHTDEDCSEPAMLSDAQCALEVKEDPPCFRRSEQYSERQLNSWSRLSADWNKSTDLWSSTKLYTFMERGIPTGVRPDFWSRLLDTEAVIFSSKFCYKSEQLLLREQLVEMGMSEYACVCDTIGHVSTLHYEGYAPRTGQVSITCLQQILLDLDRTFPTHKMLMRQTPSGTEGRAALFRMLALYARYNPQVSYCQGMSYLAAMLLMHLDEEEAFWCFVSLLEKPKYFSGYFLHNMDRIKTHTTAFARLLKIHSPKISQHFDSLGIQLIMVTPAWFICGFTVLPCWESVLAVWDLMLADGIRTLLRAGLTLLKLMENEILLTTELSTLLPMLLHPPHKYSRVDIFMPALWKVDILEFDAHCLDMKTSNGEDQQKLRTQNHVDRKRGRGTSVSTELEENLDPAQTNCNNKRRKMQHRDDTKPGPSFFRRVINIFTPKEQRLSSSFSQFRSRTRAGPADQTFGKVTPDKQTMTPKGGKSRSSTTKSRRSSLVLKQNVGNSKTNGVSSTRSSISPYCTRLQTFAQKQHIAAPMK